MGRAETSLSLQPGELPDGISANTASVFVVEYTTMALEAVADDWQEGALLGSQLPL